MKDRSERKQFHLLLRTSQKLDSQSLRFEQGICFVIYRKLDVKSLYP